MLPYLDPLLRGEQCDWTTEPNRSGWWAYKVREALHAASENADRFPELAAAHGTYKIEVTGSRSVRATPRTAPVVLVQSPSVAPHVAMQVEGNLTPLNLIEKWRAKAPGTDKLYFPNAHFDSQQLLELWELAKFENIIFFEVSGAITLMVHDEEHAPFSWTPEDLEEGATA